MKEVNIYVKGIAKSMLDNKPGSYVSVLEYEGRTKILHGNEYNTTSNRMIITGVIEAIKLLKEPCYINIYTPTKLGFKSTKVNKDLIGIIKDLIVQDGHDYNEVVTSDYIKYLENIIYKDI